jgi:uncharacterized protein YacL
MHEVSLYSAETSATGGILIGLLLAILVSNGLGRHLVWLLNCMLSVHMQTSTLYLLDSC